MSRIGNKVIEVPSGVKVSIDETGVTVEGKSKLAMTLPPFVSVKQEDGKLHVSMVGEDRRASAMQGLARSLIHNMIVGVTAGFKKELAIVGVGYRAQLAGSKLTLSLGYSHPIEYMVPTGIKLTLITEGNKIVIEGSDKQLVGEVAAEIRRFRPPEPYKGKGIRYVDEKITLKEGKSVG
ncbi:MAG: 50S ribosomal protein L6 [Victivallaceae bacterium]|nr:50S ribosomal protein L6 [Victivallaceae bacterium]